MKNFFLLSILATEILLGRMLFAQNTFPSTGAAGIGTTTPNASSLLEVKSTTKGVLLSRMTKTQRDAIVSPAQGLLIYQTNSTPGFYYYDGGWSAVAPKSANKTLSNLTVPTAINTDLVPGTNNSISLGSSSNQWKDIYFKGSQFYGSFRVFSIDTVNTNTYIGGQSGNANTSGTYNLGIGYSALAQSTIGYGNLALGNFSLFDNINGNNNTAINYSALEVNTYGSSNTAIGPYALSYTYGSDNNTAVGAYAGCCYNNGYNNVFVGTGASVNGDNYYNVIAIGNGATSTAPNQAVIGNGSTTSIGGYANWTNFSDARYKKNIQNNVPGLIFINLLKPITYTLDVEGIEAKLHPDEEQQTVNGEKIRNPMDNADMRKAMAEKSKIVYTGFAAQEVEQAAESVRFDFSGIDKPKDDQQSFYGLRYGDFVVPLVKAVQELSAKNDELKLEVGSQKIEIDELKNKVEELLQKESFGQSSMVNRQSSMNNDFVKLETLTSKPETLLGQNIPNPFNNSTLIPFRIPKDCKDASIMITNTSTSEVVSVIPISCNEDHVSIDAGTLVSGTYSYTLYVDGKMIDTKSMVILR